MVGLGDHLRSPGSTPPVACGGLILSWGVDQGFQVSGSEVSQLHRKLSVLDDGVSQNLLVPEPDVGVALQHLGVLANIWAASKLTAGSVVLKGEEATMFVAILSKSKVNASAVFGCSTHEVGHYPGYIKRQLAFRLLGHFCEPDLFSLLGLGATTFSGFRPDLHRPT